MTPRQRIALQADWWPAACRTQSWKTSDRNLRLRVCMWAVSLENPTQLSLLEAINSDRQPVRWLESTNDLDSTADVDRVKACLGMLADKLKETGEVGRPEIGRARRLRDVIRDHIKCLALYHPRPRAYVAEIIDDKFNSWRKYGPPLTIKDLTDDLIVRKDKKTGEPKEIPSQLDQLVMRLAAVVNAKRNENKLVPAYAHLQGPYALTIHEMKITAKVPCTCAECCRLRARGLIPALLPPVEVESWSDFDPELETANCADPELGNIQSEESKNPF
jgi:hypothetical protein